jgi:hypothetical protein
MQGPSLRSFSGKKIAGNTFLTAPVSLRITAPNL